MNDYVAACLGMDGAVFDKYEDAFDVEITDNDVYDALFDCASYGDYSRFGSCILQSMWAKVAEDYNDVLDEEKFECDTSSTSCPDFYYDGKRVDSKKDLDKIVESLEI
jgi:hypothetical protein